MELAPPPPRPFHGPAGADAGGGPGAVPVGEELRRGIGVVMAAAGGTVRRRSRQAVSRPRVVQFSLTEEEFEDVSRAAERSACPAMTAATGSRCGTAGGGWPPS